MIAAARGQVDNIASCWFETYFNSHVSSSCITHSRVFATKSPYLPPPDRAHVDHFWLTSRVKRLSEVLWRKCGKKCILISCLVLFVFAFIVSFINLLPDILIGFIFG
uniref:Transmembrane protein n=1 Tax=Ascaris lumbricoides TaxID=6252 RepID=A0A0M3HEU5_ASCLU